MATLTKPIACVLGGRLLSAYSSRTGTNSDGKNDLLTLNCALLYKLVKSISVINSCLSAVYVQLEDMSETIVAEVGGSSYRTEILRDVFGYIVVLTVDVDMKNLHGVDSASVNEFLHLASDIRHANWTQPLSTELRRDAGILRLRFEQPAGATLRSLVSDTQASGSVLPGLVISGLLHQLASVAEIWTRSGQRSQCTLLLSPDNVFVNASDSRVTVVPLFLHIGADVSADQTSGYKILSSEFESECCRDIVSFVYTLLVRSTAVISEPNPQFSSGAISKDLLSMTLSSFHALWKEFNVKDSQKTFRSLKESSRKMILPQKGSECADRVRACMNLEITLWIRSLCLIAREKDLSNKEAMLRRHKKKLAVLSRIMQRESMPSRSNADSTPSPMQGRTALISQYPMDSVRDG